MPKVAFIEVPPDLQYAYSKLFAPVTKTTNSSVRWKGGIIPARKKYNYTQKSMLPNIRDLWNALSPEEQEAWKVAGAAQNYNAWNAFVQDTAYRMKFGLIGTATPSPYHSYKVGRVELASPATQFRLLQLHPIQYFKMQKVRGTKSQFEPQAITEVLHLPLTVGLSFRSNLTAIGDNPYCKFYADITYSYQATDKKAAAVVDIPLVSDWTREESTISNVVGHARWYTLVLEFNNVRGAVEFDVLKSLHNGTNFARDFRCTNIGAGYSNTNYQLPPSWVADEVTPGAQYGSVYPSDDPL